MKLFWFLFALASGSVSVWTAVTRQGWPGVVFPGTVCVLALLCAVEKTPRN